MSEKALVKKRGRPPEKRNQAMADEVCRRLIAGESLRQMEKGGLITAHRVIRWLADDPNFRQQYARARESQADTLADEMLDVARAATPEDAQAKRLLVDVLKWRAGKLRPKVYGDKIDLTHAGPDGGPIQSVTATMTAEEAAQIYRERISRG